MTGYIYKIYKIDNSLPENQCYIGATTNPTKRRHCHKRRTINSEDSCYNFPVYQFIRNNGGWDAWTTLVLETVNFGDDKYELARREAHWVKTHGAVLNTISAPVHKEGTPEQKEAQLEQGREYNAKRRADPEFRERKRIMDKEYRERLGEELLARKREARVNSPERFRAYEKAKYEKNKEAILLQQKEYHRKNKELRTEQNKVRWAARTEEQKAKDAERLKINREKYNANRRAKNCSQGSRGSHQN